MTTDQAVSRQAAHENLTRILTTALQKIERLSRTADRDLVDVPAMLGDIARSALVHAREQA